MVMISTSLAPEYWVLLRQEIFYANQHRSYLFPRMIRLIFFQNVPLVLQAAYLKFRVSSFQNILSVVFLVGVFTNISFDFPSHLQLLSPTN